MEKLTVGSRQDLTSKMEDRRSTDLRSIQVKKIVETAGLANERFFAYHCKAVKTIGATKYLDLADMAKQGKNPTSLMSYLLKEEMTMVEAGASQVARLPLTR